MRLLESHNKYPECLLMELEAIPLSSGTTDTEEFDLYLTVNFNEQWESLLDGRIKFGLKSGQLRLRWENLDVSVVAPELDGGLAIATVNSQETTNWVFHPPQGKTLLKGLSKQGKLGTCKILAKPFRLKTIFAVSGQDISLTDTEGLWRHDISPNKHAVLERKLALFLLENKFKPYLSWTQLGSQEDRSWQIGKEDKDKGMVTQATWQLKEVIDRVYEAKTDNFLELAKITNLDPAQDFAGGNFLAADLSGVELNNTNLYLTNFRGADLTDADLSEASLSHAKLSGADLSGAYLENANLSYTDLHRASLAIANLIAADLSGANLTDANLSNANLTSAKVSPARFGHNPGISEEMKLSLIERGAIFE